MQGNKLVLIQIDLIISKPI